MVLYAIVESGGRQVRVEPGTQVTIDRLVNGLGDKITFDRVLFVATDTGDFVAGKPFIQGARVTGVLYEEKKGPKIRVFRRKRRKGMRRTTGHRAKLSRVQITDIEME